MNTLSAKTRQGREEIINQICGRSIEGCVISPDLTGTDAAFVELQLTNGMKLSLVASGVTNLRIETEQGLPQFVETRGDYFPLNGAENG